MSVAPVRPAHAGAGSAISAFLRGIERRARVLARLQAGDQDAGDAALADAVRAFAAEAHRQPLAQWPQRFWSALLGTAPLRSAAVGTAGWPALAPGPRAALLLRWAGGLDDAAAAQVLGVSAATFRLALHRALDAAGHGATALQAEVDARLASAAEAPPVPGPELMDADADGAIAPPPCALLIVLWGLLAACVLAFAATFAAPPEADGDATGPTPLPESAPAARYTAADGAIVHRDFALLVDADAAAWLDDLEFHAWLAAGAPAPLHANAGEAPATAFVPSGAETTLETLDAL